MNVRWLFLAYAALFVFGLADNIRGPLYPELLSHFQITHSEGSWFFALVSFMSVVSAILAPALISYLGHLRVLRLSLLFLVLSQFIFGWAPRFGLVLIGSLIFGFGVGALSVVQNVMVLLGSEARYHQKFQSALHACYGGASLLAPLLVIVVAHFFGGWQGSFLVSGFLILILLLGSYFPWPRESKIFSLPKKQMSFRSFWTLEETFFAMILGLYVGLEVLVGSRLASFFREVFHADLKTSSWAVMTFFSGLLLGRVLFILWHPRKSLKTQLLISMTLILVSLVGGLFLWAPFLLVSGFFMGPFYPIMMTAVGRLFPRRLEENMALCNALQGLNLVLVHTFVGFISDLWGLKVAMSFGIALSVVTILMLCLYSRLFRRAFG